MNKEGNDTYRDIMSKILCESYHYRIRDKSEHTSFSICNVYNRNENSSYLGTTISEFVPSDIKIWILSQVLKIKWRNGELFVAHDCVWTNNESVLLIKANECFVGGVFHKFTNECLWNFLSLTEPLHFFAVLGSRNNARC